MILLFDLGGVLIDFRGIESMHAISKGTVDTDSFWRFWSQSVVTDRLYRGKCTPEEFAAGAVAEWNLSVTPAEFLSEFKTWLVGPYPGAFELLDRLRPNHTLACLSNINEIDCVRLREAFRLEQRFDRCFFSNEIGFRKPEPNCYRFALQELDAQPQQVVFFDDSQECIEGARSVGLSAHCCMGFEALTRQLQTMGLLDAEPNHRLYSDAR